MIDDSFWTILGLFAVGLVPLAALFLFFKPRPYQPPKDKSPSAMEEVLREPPESVFREQSAPLPTPVPGQPEQSSLPDETFLEWLGQFAKGILFQGVLEVSILLAALFVVMVVIVLFD
ncbi:MAG: hypothetical protein FD177_777 [Desulfovibrionaceae bacterium]|nr:MAG: hypothetical protein FD177_777 [Desulfovibrionaceae bacterium]